MRFLCDVPWESYLDIFASEYNCHFPDVTGRSGYSTYQGRTQWYTTVHTHTVLYVPTAYAMVQYCSYSTCTYQDALTWRSTDDLHTVHTVLYVPTAYTVVHYGSVHTCKYCTKKLLLGGAPMIYGHTYCTYCTVRTNLVPSGILWYCSYLYVLYCALPRSSCWEEHPWFIY